MTFPDKAFHLTSAFTATVLILRMGRRLHPLPILIAICLGCILLEVYQWHNEPMYTLKALDTVLDLIADGAGITLAAWHMEIKWR